MVAIESERKWRFVLFLITLEICMSMSVFAAMNDTESDILEWISRRQLSPDIYKSSSSNGHGVCTNEKSVYLISEKQCVKEQELLNGMLLISIKSDHYFL